MAAISIGMLTAIGLILIPETFDIELENLDAAKD
jgi:hypothetical protein